MIVFAWIYVYYLRLFKLSVWIYGYMSAKNDVFMIAFDYLVKEKKVKSQKQLAEKIGVSQNTITRIKKHEVEVSDDTIRALVNSFDGLFNMDYFRGRSVFLTNEDLGDYLTHPDKYTYVFPGDKELLEKYTGKNKHDQQFDDDKQQSSQIDLNKYIEMSAYNDIVALMKENIDGLKSQIADLRSQLVDKDKRIEANEDIITLLRQRVAFLESSFDNPAERYPFPIGVADAGNNNKEQACI